MWASLIPLILGSAILPMQIIVTIVLRRSQAGLLSAAGFVAGMTVLRLLQGMVLGLLIGSAQSMETQLATGAGPVLSTILLVAGVLLLATALRQSLTGEDPDAPPPRWLGMAESMRPGSAFGFGMLLVALGGKWWLFTLGAVAAITDADLGHPATALAYVLFVALAELPVILIVLLSALAPTRSAPLLDAVSTWMEDHSHGIVIAACLVFGLWFVVKALNDFGVL